MLSLVGSMSNHFSYNHGRRSPVNNMETYANVSRRVTNGNDGVIETNGGFGGMEERVKIWIVWLKEVSLWQVEVREQEGPWVKNSTYTIPNQIGTKSTLRYIMIEWTQAILDKSPHIQIHNHIIHYKGVLL